MIARAARASKRISSKQAGRRSPDGEPTSSRSPSSQRTTSKGSRPGTERARDEQRDIGGPRYAGGPWKLADERGDRRFGHARVDDADRSELAPGEANNDDNDWPSAADPELAAAEARREIESGGQHAGMRRGEKPRKPKTRER